MAAIYVDHERMNRFRKELEDMLAGAALKLANEHGHDMTVEVEARVFVIRPLLTKAEVKVTLNFGKYRRYEC